MVFSSCTCLLCQAHSVRDSSPSVLPSQDAVKPDNSACSPILFLSTSYTPTNNPLPSSMQPKNQTQPKIRPFITRFKPRFLGCRYQHTARVVSPGLKRVLWKTLYLKTPRKSRSQGGWEGSDGQTRWEDYQNRVLSRIAVLW